MKRKLVGGIECNHLFESLVGLCGLFLLREQLPQEKPLARFLFAPHLVFDDALQIDDGLLRVARVQIVVGIGVVPFFLCLPVHGVARHVAQHLFGIIAPTGLNIAFGQPGLCPLIDGGLRGIEAAHVGKGGDGIFEIAFEELRTSHQEPHLPHRGVIFPSVKPLNIFGRFAAVFVPNGVAFDAVQANSFLTFGNGEVVMGLSYGATLFVADGIERQLFGEMVVIAILFFQRSVDIGHRGVVVDIIFRVKRLPPSRG